MRASSFRLTAVVVSGLAVLSLGVLYERFERFHASSGVPPLMAADTPAPLKIEPLASPASKNSSEPQFGVQGDRVTLSWVEVNGERATLRFAERTASGWSDVHNVAAGNNFFINAFDVPSVHALADGTLAADWEERLGADEDSDASKVMLSWSKDQGHTWSRPVSPHHDGTETEHGFVSLFQAPGAGLGAVWIDGRATDPKTESGDMSLRASFYDAAGKQLSETVVVPRVCECCSTSAAQTPDGVIVAFRNRSADEIRDIYVTRFAAGKWSAPAIVHADGWMIDACPINGPSIAARGRDVAVAWFMAKNDQGRAFLAFSHDGGSTFGPPVRVDDASSLGRLGVQLLDDGSAAVMWIEKTSQDSQLRVRIVSPAGVRSAPVKVATTEGSRYPRMTRYHDELLFAWTDTDNGSQVKIARAALARQGAGLPANEETTTPGKQMSIERPAGTPLQVVDVSKIMPGSSSAPKNPSPVVQADGTLAFRPGQTGVSYPSCLYCPEPQYTEEASKAKFNGIVVLQVIIEPDGHADNIQLVKGAGFGLDEKAVEAVRTWRFKPAIGPDGAAVATITPIEILFRKL